MHMHTHTHKQQPQTRTHFTRWKTIARYILNKQLFVWCASNSHLLQANFSNLHLKPIKNKTIIIIILNKYIQVHIHEKGIRTTLNDLQHQTFNVLLRAESARTKRLSTEAGSKWSRYSLTVHRTWPKLKSAQSHCSQELAQTEIGSLTVHSLIGRIQASSNITCPAPKKHVPIQYWANLALTQHLNWNIPPSLHTQTHTPCNGREEVGTHTAW